MKRLIETTEHYRVYEADFMGHTQTFRQWNDDTVEIKFTNEFAKGNGFKDIPDMLNQNIGMRESLIVACSELPTWITIDKDGSFKVRKTQIDESFN